MAMLLGAGLTLIVLITGILTKTNLAIILLLGWAIFAAIALNQGHRPLDILRWSYRGSRQSFGVIRVFALIGPLIGIWMAAGTIPTLVKFSLNAISPGAFLLCAFLICSVVSAMIGTSFGTVSMIGIPLMMIARLGGMDVHMTAGAIIAGAYVGDRCSPVSSSAALVASLSRTSQLSNLQRMLRSSLTPFALSAVIYAGLSAIYPLHRVDAGIAAELGRTFVLGPTALFPALLLLALSLIRVRLEKTLVISIVAAAGIAILVQHAGVHELLQALIWGFNGDNGGAARLMIHGGGLFSMTNTAFAVLVSCALAGLLEGTRFFDRFKNALQSASDGRSRQFGVMTLVSLLAAAIGGSQSTATVMTHTMMQDSYQNPSNLALDLENSGVLLSALIPWNIAALAPATALGVSTYSFIPYAFYLYLLPLLYFAGLAARQKSEAWSNGASAPSRSSLFRHLMPV